MRRRWLARFSPWLVLVAAIATHAEAPGSRAGAKEWSTAVEGPAYTAAGRLKYPAAYREWIFLSSGIDMSYSERGDAMGHSMFDNVFAEPEAYREFARTGRWPDGTVLVLEVRGAAEQGSINKHGKFQTGELMGVEAHVKDTQRFPGGWGFFAFRGGPEPAALIPMSEDCYSCHREHAALDTTFVQFYPTLREIAERQGTLGAGFKP